MFVNVMLRSQIRVRYDRYSKRHEVSSYLTSINCYLKMINDLITGIVSKKDYLSCLNPRPLSL